MHSSYAIVSFRMKRYGGVLVGQDEQGEHNDEREHIGALVRPITRSINREVAFVEERAIQTHHVDRHVQLKRADGNSTEGALLDNLGKSEHKSESLNDGRECYDARENTVRNHVITDRNEQACDDETTSLNNLKRNFLINL